MGTECRVPGKATAEREQPGPETDRVRANVISRHTPLIPEFRGRGREVENNLVYKMSSRTARVVTQRNTIWENQKEEKIAKRIWVLKTEFNKGPGTLKKTRLN